MEEGIERLKFAVRIYFLVTADATPVKSHQHEHLKHEDTSEHAKLDWEMSPRPQPYTKNYRELSQSGNRRGGPPQE